MIIKFILKTGEEVELGHIKPKEDFKESYISRGEEKTYINTSKYQKQFYKFENKILKELHNDIVEDYAKFEFDLIEQDDCECNEDDKNISDFDDEEISEEFYHRNGLKLSLISKNHLDRFIKIINTCNTKEIEKFLIAQEIKNNL